MTNITKLKRSCISALMISSSILGAQKEDVSAPKPAVELKIQAEQAVILPYDHKRDAQSIVAILNQTGSLGDFPASYARLVGVPDNFIKTFVNHLKVDCTRDDYFIRICRLNGKTIGFLVAHKIDSDLLHIDNLAVDKSICRQGYGRMLYDSAWTHVIASDHLTQLDIGASSGNIIAKRAYRKWTGHDGGRHHILYEKYKDPKLCQKFTRIDLA